MPVVNPKMMPIFPLDGDAIRANVLNPNQMGGRLVFIGHVKNFWGRFRSHLIMTTTAFGAWAGITQQGEGIDTRVPVIPADGELPGFFIGSNLFGKNIIHGFFNVILLYNESAKRANWQD